VRIDAGAFGRRHLLDRPAACRAIERERSVLLKIHRAVNGLVLFAAFLLSLPSKLISPPGEKDSATRANKGQNDSLYNSFVNLTCVQTTKDLLRPILFSVGINSGARPTAFALFLMLERHYSCTSFYQKRSRP
jgi:hypothetical protein